MSLTAKLDDRHATLAFRTTILDGDVVQVYGPVPLVGLLGAQARVLLPAHTAQIEALAGA